MDLPEIPDKPYFRIGEAAKLLGIEAHVLRYWESEFPQLKPTRAASKQRLYRREDIETLLTIRQLVHEERYTIAGAKERLAEMASGRASASQRQVVAEVCAELKDILKLLD